MRARAPKAQSAKAQSAEDRLIARYFRPVATHPGAFALGDDAAALTPPAGADLVLTTDAIVGGVHFFPDDPADLVAKKALRVNLSDLAAKGAKPAGLAPLAARSERFTRKAFFATMSPASSLKKCTPPTIASAVRTRS